MRVAGSLTWRLPDGSTRESTAYGPLNILGHAEIDAIALPQKCGGQAECGTCRIKVVEGAVTDPSVDEVILMARHASRFADGERLGCRVRPRGDITVMVPVLMPVDLRDEAPDPECDAVPL